MKLYERDQFLAQPAGVIYFKGKEWYFEGLEIKEETCAPHGEPIDWFCINPAWVEAWTTGEAIAMLESMKQGASGPMQETMSRDGMFDHDEIFLVLERADLLKLREWVDRALEVADA